MKILVIEDDPVLVNLFRQTFARSPEFTMDSADNLKEGIRIASETKPHLIMLDFALPDSDADSTPKHGVRNIRQVSPDSAILGCTGYASDKRVKDAMENGADAVIEKGSTFNKGNLAKAMCTALEHHGGATQGFIIAIEGLLGVTL